MDTGMNWSFLLPKSTWWNHNFQWDAWGMRRGRWEVTGSWQQGTQNEIRALVRDVFSLCYYWLKAMLRNTALICLATSTTCLVVSVIPAVRSALNVLIFPQLPCPTLCAPSHFLGYLSKQQWVRHKRWSPVSIYIFTKSNWCDTKTYSSCF